MKVFGTALAACTFSALLLSGGAQACAPDGPARFDNSFYGDCRNTSPNLKGAWHEPTERDIAPNDVLAGPFDRAKLAQRDAMYRELAKETGAIPGFEATGTTAATAPSR